mmetsp:Transcript_5477/g.17630  ORF Transcript_5477/g.17630 Transcript_5477/m.17630 type:complete len:174 (-) Transcript_5477:77-598(-)
MPPISPPDGAHACTSFVANAAVAGAAFEWHVDADPSSFPDGCRWVEEFGDYCNGQPGKPLFVSLVVYTDAAWPPSTHADTLFVQPEGGVGLLVQPRPGRCVLLQQDALHRVAPPSAAAGRPRYSLVWKLLFVPKAPSAVGGALGGPQETISRPEWGPPLAFGRRPSTGCSTTA